MKPENRALQDRVMAVLIDALPEALTGAQIAERVGGMKTRTMSCVAGVTFTNGHVGRCRVGNMDRERFANIQHHDGDPAWDSWETVYDSLDMTAPLNRLARDGMVSKIKLPHLRHVLWRWVGPVDPTIGDLETMWKLEHGADQ